MADRLAEFKKEAQRRDCEIELRVISEEDRTIELAFSSEFEVKRWWGLEVLGHKKGEVRLDRLRSGTAALLVNHNPDDQVGVVEKGGIEEDGKGRAVVRFGKSARAEEIFQDVKDKIRRLVSVGYRIHEAKFVEEREGGVEVWRMTDWEPMEISIASVPADPSVGVGRSTEAPQEVPAPVRKEGAHTQGEKNRMGDQEKPTISVDAERKHGSTEEHARASAILKMGADYKQRDLAHQAVIEGKTVDQFREVLLQKMNEQTSKPLGEQMRAGEVGLTDKEAKSFSFMKAIRFLANPHDAQAREAAKFEIECSRAAQDKSGKEAKGIMVPNDVLVRTLSTTTPSGAVGANIIATELAAGSFIELLRKRSFALGRGRKLAGLVGNLDIPRQKSGATAYWVGEGSAPTASEIGVDKISLTPKTLGAYSDITRRMLLQSTPDAEALTRDDIIKTLALALDNAAIYGSGSSNQPKGVKNWSGINGVDFAAANPTFAELVSMESEVAADNADVGSLAYVANAKFRGYAKSTVKFSSTDATIWEPGNTINGYECAVTNQLIDGDVFFGNWDDLLIGLWSGIDLMVDQAALATSGGVRVIALQDVDINVRHLESFCWGSALVTP